MRRRAEFWAEHLAAQRASGHSQRAYCAQHGIKARNLRRWAHRLQRTGGGPAAGPAADAAGPGSPGAGDRTSTGAEVPPEAAALPGPVPEILAGPEQRRRWTPEQKMRLVMETLRPGASISAVARRHGVHSSVVFRWRRQLVTRAPGAEGSASAPGDDGRGPDRAPEAGPRLVPVRVADAARPAAVAAPAIPAAASAHADRVATGRIEIELAGGARLRVDRDVDAEALRRVLAALAGAAAGGVA